MGQRLATDATANLLNTVLGELFLDDAADVIGSENRGRD